MTYAKPDIASDDPGGPVLGVLRHRMTECLTVLYLLTVVYNSLVPLDLGMPGPTPDGAFRAFGLPVAAFSVPDAASNIAFYFPLGMLLCATLTKDGWGRWAALATAVLLAAGISYAMELAQTWSRLRVSSAWDCLYNVAGAATGAIASPWLVVIARQFRRTLRRELRDRPSLVLTGLLAVGLVALALVPLDVTFSVDQVRDAVKRAHVVPFEKLARAGEPRPAGEGSGGFAAEHLASADWWALMLDYVTWSALYAALSMIACYYLRAHGRVGAIRAGSHAFGMCVVCALAGSTVQLFVLSRGLDATVPLFQVVGAAVGALLQPLVLGRAPERHHAAAPRIPSVIRRAVAASLVLALAIVAAREVAPFRFTTSSESVAAQIERVDWLPMAGYQHVRLHTAVDDILGKLLRFVLLGALITGWRRLRSVAPAGERPWRTGMWVAMGIACLETLQILLPSRVPGITDVLLAGFGAMVGVYACQLGRLWWGEVGGPDLDAATVHIDYRIDLGPPKDVRGPRKPSRSADEISGG